MNIFFPPKAGDRCCPPWSSEMSGSRIQCRRRISRETPMLLPDLVSVDGHHS